VSARFADGGKRQRETRIPMQGMFFDWLKYVVHSIPAFAFYAWMGLLIWESWTATPKIIEVQKKYDPHGEFVLKTNSYRWFNVNDYYVNTKHSRYTPEFLKEWNSVYQAHWRRLYVGILLFPAVGYGSQFLRSLIERTIFQ
jgi:hypothetical protein